MISQRAMATDVIDLLQNETGVSKRKCRRGQQETKACFEMRTWGLVVARVGWQWDGGSHSRGAPWPAVQYPRDAFAPDSFPSWVTLIPGVRAGTYVKDLCRTWCWARGGGLQVGGQATTPKVQPVLFINHGNTTFCFASISVCQLLLCTWL